MLILVTGCAGLPSFLSAPAPEVGALAPNFTLKDLDGKDVSLSDLRGQVVLINFWATWCGPCRDEMPAIQSRYDRGGFAVLAIDFAEDPLQVRSFLNELGVNLPALLDPDGRVQELYRVRGYPTSFFIDADGIVRFFHIGEMNEADFQSFLAQMGVEQ